MLRRALAVAVTGLALALGVETSSAASHLADYVYVHDRGTVSQVFAWELDADGTLTALPGSPFVAPGMESSNCGGHCKSVAYSRRHRVLYTSHSAGVMAWSVAEDGSLTVVPGAPFGGTDSFGVIVANRGRRTFVYASNYDDGNVRAYEAAADGSLAEIAGSPFAAQPGALGQALGKGVLCVYNQNSASISSWKIAADGTLVEAPDSPLSLPGTDVWFVDSDPKGRYGYVASDSTVTAVAINRRTGSLTEVEGNPFDFGLTDHNGGVAVGRRFAYVPGYLDPDPVLQAFRIGRGGVAVPAGEPLVTDLSGDDVEGLAVDARGRRMVMVGSSSALRSFTLDPRTGAPTAADSETYAGGGTNGLVIVRR